MIELIKTVNQNPKESLFIGVFSVIIVFILCATIVESIKLFKNK
jgi:hypothetical protein